MSTGSLNPLSEALPCTPTARRHQWFNVETPSFLPLGRQHGSSPDVGASAQSISDLSSPSNSKAYPITPMMSEYLRNRRERFFTRPMPARSLADRADSSSASHRSSRGAGLPSSSAQRSGPHVNPFGSTSRADGDANESARILRQQFRQRCQAAMARDRQRDRARRLQSSRSSAAEPSSDQEHLTPLNSDDLSSSDYDDGSAMLDWENEDEEMIRRIMTADYRRMLRAQERQGDVELGWLGPEEVAWLEEEIHREEGLGHRQEAEGGIEPPPDLVDEDEMLCDMYEHAQSQAQQPKRMTELPILDGDEEDFSWVNEADLALESPSRTRTDGYGDRMDVTG